MSFVMCCVRLSIGLLYFYKFSSTSDLHTHQLESIKTSINIFIFGWILAQWYYLAFRLILVVEFYWLQYCHWQVSEFDLCHKFKFCQIFPTILCLFVCHKLFGSWCWCQLIFSIYIIASRNHHNMIPLSSCERNLYKRQYYCLLYTISRARWIW